MASTETSAEFSLSRNAPWLRPVEWVSYRPLRVFFALLLILTLVWNLAWSFEAGVNTNRTLLIDVGMVSIYLLPMLMFCYVLRYVRHDVVTLREFDPDLPDFSFIMPTRNIAAVEIFFASFFGLVFLIIISPIVYGWPVSALFQSSEVPLLPMVFLLVMLLFMNTMTIFVVIFVVRLLILLTKYADVIRLSLFRYRTYSIFSGLFVLLFCGTVILFSALQFMAPALGYDAFLTTLISVPIYIPLTIFVGLPIWRISRRMGEAKAAELNRVERLIDQEVTGHKDELNSRLEQLLNYERQVLDIWVWPFSTQIKQMLFFGLLPPLSWLLGAFIEIAVEQSI